MGKPEGKPEDGKLSECNSPGGLFPNGLLFEQVEDGNYVMWDAEYTEILRRDSIVYDKVYCPLPRLLWPAVGMPADYEYEELWQDIRQFIYEHLFLPDEALYDVLTAWVIATWTPEFWPVVPYVFFYGAVASGKTRGLEVLHRLAYRAILTVNASAAAIAYAIDNWKATIILDETEIYSKAEKTDIIGILNAGYKSGQSYMRIRYVDGQKQPDYAETFGFKALAGTHGLAEALESRSIVIRMMKNRRKVRLFLDEKWAYRIRCKLLMYRMKTLQPVVRTTKKEDVEKPVAERLAEISETLLKNVPVFEFSNARVNELFQSLLAVSNEGRERIADYAVRMDNVTAQEEMASEEAELVHLLSKMGIGGDNVVLTSAIKDAWNKERPKEEQWNSRSLGWLIRRLGFTQKHTNKGNGWLLERARLKYLADTYTTKKTSETSQLHFSHKIVHSEVFRGEKQETSPWKETSLENEVLNSAKETSPETSPLFSHESEVLKFCEVFPEMGGNREIDTPHGMSNCGEVDNGLGLFAFCSACHEEKRLGEMSEKPGKPTCKKCAGELVEQ